MFQQAFINSSKTLTSDEGLIHALWNEIVNAYTSPDRHYHNLQHLDNLLQEVLPLQQHIKDWHVVVFAIAYHDFVYEPIKQNNEEKSAACAEEKLGYLIDNLRLAKCKNIILATKRHEQSDDPDINYFTDADLSILGKPKPEYLSYTLKIRKEYKIFPDLIYKPGRKKVVRHFLEMERIYKSEYFYHKYELSARQNLTEELQALV